jgi:hypothetical protein
MPQYQAVTRSRYAARRYRRPGDLRHLANQTSVPLVAQEFARVALQQPIAFVERDGGYAPVAILSLYQGRNLFVTADGKWLAPYLPRLYQTYPFALGAEEGERFVLAVDEDSGLISDTDGDPFFDGDELSAPLQKVREELARLAQARKATEAICELLVKHELIVPWEIRLTAGEAEQAVAGLHRVDEARLNALQAAAFLALRRVGALPAIYCHLLSMQQMPALGRLAAMHGQSAASAAQRGGQARAPASPAGGAATPVSLDFLSTDGSIDFGKLD